MKSRKVHTKKRNPTLPDQHQNFWHLASIQAMSFSFPGLILPGILAKQYGNGTALCSLLVANLILWLISVAIVSMSSKKKNHAIENVKQFFGIRIGLFVSLILLVAFLVWYALQIMTFQFVVNILNMNPLQSFNWIFGLIAGIIIAFFSIGGIYLIRRAATVIFPILLIFIGYILIKFLPEIQFSGTWGISYTAVALSIVIELTGTVNLPTFFRHSNSKADSMLALIIITIYLNINGLTGICLGANEIAGLVKFFSHSTSAMILVLFFSILSLVGTNLVNVYFASAGWESLFPRIRGRKMYFILGIVGSIIFVFFHNYSLDDSPLVIFTNLSNGFLSCLAISLLFAYAIVLIVRHRLRPYEQFLNSIIWIGGCLGFLVLYLFRHWSWSEALSVGIWTVVFSFLIVLYIEETTWAASKVFKK